MAHNIPTRENADGTVDAAFVAAREPAWHRLGTVFEDRDGITVAEALEHAHLDYTVTLEDVVTANGTPAPRHKATVIDHPFTGERHVLGIVGKGYTPFQTRDAFAFLEALADESGAWVNTAGALRDWRSAFITMRMPEELVLDPNGMADGIRLYLFCTTSHDGSSSATFAVSPTRIVCENTETIALRNAKRTTKLQHRAGIHGHVAEARDNLGLTFRYVDAWEEEVRKLFVPMTTERFEAWVAEELVPDAAEGAPVVVTDRIDHRREELSKLWKGETVANIAETRWAAWNVWTEWLDHYRPTVDDDGVKRAEDVVEGAHATAKGKAFRSLVKL